MALSDNLFGCLRPWYLRAMSNPFRYFNSSSGVIRLVVMMYVRYPLSLRFGLMFAAEIKKKRLAHMRGITQWRWHLDEVFVKI
jgi:putative transposase